MTALAKIPRAIDYASAGPSVIPAVDGNRVRNMDEVTVEDIVKEFGRTPALRGVSAANRRRRTDGTPRALRLGKDDAAEGDRRARNPGRRPCPVRRRGRDEHPVQKRKVGFVFQHYALFRHMRVHDNRRLRPARPPARHPAERDRDPRARHEPARPRPAVRAGEAVSRPTLRRPAPARGAWPARWRSSRASCCSTSRSARSTPRCARICAAGCARSTIAPAKPRCSSPTIRTKRWNSPTAWWS